MRGLFFEPRSAKTVDNVTVFSPVIVFNFCSATVSKRLLQFAVTSSRRRCNGQITAVCTGLTGALFS